MRAGTSEVVRLEGSPCWLSAGSASGSEAGSSAVDSGADLGYPHGMEHRPRHPQSDYWTCSS